MTRASYDEAIRTLAEHALENELAPGALMEDINPDIYQAMMEIENDTAIQKRRFH